jgi:monovalent cation:H+ antiporter-2, CPA2 family
MHDGLPLITTIAAAFGLALVLGLVAVRLKLPALVGYLLAGVLIGPFTPGFVADTGIAGELAEIDLMLVVGRRFFPALLWQIAHFGSRELFTLCIIAAAGANRRIFVHIDRRS